MTIWPKRGYSEEKKTIINHLLNVFTRVNTSNRSGLVILAESSPILISAKSVDAVAQFF